MIKFILLTAAMFWGASAAAAPARQTISLNGDWLFQRDGAKADDWKTVPVPSSFEQHEGIAFDGVGWYRKSIPPFALPAGKRVLLHFQAAATEAEVWWNGEKLGTHLGGWTPFRFDITEQVRKAPAGQPHELRVRLDEKVGHNTQGFLPIIAPHFGGLWQDVQLLVVPETYCDDLRLLAVGDLGKSEFRLDIPLGRHGARDHAAGQPSAAGFAGETDWTVLPLQTTLSRKIGFRLRRPLANPRLWSPDEPNLYELEIALGRRRTATGLIRGRLSHDRSLRPAVAPERPAAARFAACSTGATRRRSPRPIRARRSGGRNSSSPGRAASTS